MNTSLSIDRVVGHIVECGLDFTYSSGTLSNARAIIWEVHAGDVVGLGECGMASEKSCPGFGADADTHDEGALAAALEPRVARLLGGDAMQLEALLEPMPDQVDWDLLVIREGLSIALYDLVGRATGRPAHALLGGKRRSALPGMPVVHVGPVDVMARRAAKWAAAGYRHVKVKFRGDLAVDVEALGAIRAAVGRSVELVVDANAGYREIDDALRAIAALQPFDVYYFEDMLAADDHLIAELRRRSGARIMVDRQAWWPHVRDIVEAGAADVINHHPNNQGGLAVALMIDQVAVAAGLETAIGSCGVFGIQNAAFMQLAAVVGLTRPCEDIGLLPYYAGPTQGEYAFDREPSVIAAHYPIEQGTIHVPDAPGLDVTLDHAKLSRCKIGEIAYE